MVKINFYGTDRSILPSKPVKYVPADKAIRGRKVTTSKRINLNPPRRDCIAWTDKQGNLIFRTDYENKKYFEYVERFKKGLEPLIGKDLFIEQLWS